jgi:hypothetical protein
MIQRLIKNQRVFIFLFIVLIVAYLLELKTGPGSGQHDGLERLEVIAMVSDLKCDVGKKTCKAISENRSIELLLGPGVSALKKFPIRLQLSGFQKDEIRKVVVGYSMKGMDMGINRNRLSSSDLMQWKGEGVLPICTSGRSDWLVIVEVSTQGRLYTATFGFTLNSQSLIKR